MQRVKEIIIEIVNYLPFGKLITGLYFLSKNHLTKSGWRKSNIQRLPIDASGKELPWFTYSFIYFLESRLHENMTVFEYGSGHSTLWFSTRVHSIVSVEHDQNWYTAMKEKFVKLPSIQYIYIKLDSGGYENEILNYTKAVSYTHLTLPTTSRV